MARTQLTISNAEVRFGAAPTTGGVDPATLTNYSCQFTEARIQSSANVIDVPATFCEPSSQRAVPSSFSLECSGLQDWGVAGSLSEFLFLHDGEVQAFAMYLNGDDHPRATGICSISAGDFGGPAGTALTWTQSFPILGRPDITKQDGTSIRPDTGGGVAATGATAGSPGTWTPVDSNPPANAAGATSAGITATPATAWTTGQYVQGSTAGVGGELNWNGTAWVSGRRP